MQRKLGVGLWAFLVLAAIVHAGPAQGEKPAVCGQGQLCQLDDLVPAVIIAEQRFRSRRDPLHRPPDPPRRPCDDRLLGMEAALHAEAAADIAGDDADAALRHVQYLVREGVAYAVHMLCAGIEGVAAGALIVLGDTAARLHRNRGNPIVHQ